MHDEASNSGGNQQLVAKMRTGWWRLLRAIVAEILSRSEGDKRGDQTAPDDTVINKHSQETAT